MDSDNDRGLEEDKFLKLVEYGPLVSIDLVIRNESDQLVLGLRNNEPAKGAWFVPGGRIRKSEEIGEAFKRVCNDELRIERELENANFLGVYRHDHDTNFAEAPDINTVYIVLAYEVRVPDDFSLKSLPDGNPPKFQHSEFRWFDYESARTNSEVHRYA